MKKSVVIGLHLGFWFSYFVLGGVIAGVLYGSGNLADEAQVEKALSIIFFFVQFPSFIAFYLFYFFLFPRFLQKGKWGLTLLLGVLVSIFAGVVGNTIFYFLPISWDCAADGTLETYLGAVAFIAFIALINGIIAMVIRGFITWFDEIKLKEKLKEKNHEMEMALVKAQLDPHFLFNTINNIDVLIVKNAEDASAYLNKLSDIMRFMLFETKTDEISLSQELRYIEKYIELQKIRTANTEYIDYEVVGDAQNKKIAPMVFIPFIENAFKHTTNKKLKNAIQIKIIISEDAVELQCENKFDPFRKTNQESNGLGNGLIEKRLQLIYPNSHTLKMDSNNGLYRVNLKITHG